MWLSMSIIQDAELGNLRVPLTPTYPVSDTNSDSETHFLTAPAMVYG